MAGDHMDFEDYPNIGYARAQARGANGKFYFALDNVRCEYGGFYSAETQASTLGLDVPAGKILHVKSLMGDSPADTRVRLREGSAAGAVVYQMTLAPAPDSMNTHSNIVGFMVSGDLYVELNTYGSSVGLFIGGILDPNPTRE